MTSPDETVEPSPTPPYLATFDPDERPSERTIAAVAAVSGRPMTTLSPLYDVIEPDALDALFEHANRPDHSSEIEVDFRYEGFDVRVTGDGRIRLERRSRPPAGVTGGGR